MGMDIEGDRDKDGVPNKDDGRTVRIGPGSHTSVAELTFSRRLVSTCAGAWGHTQGQVGLHAGAPMVEGTSAPRGPQGTDGWASGASGARGRPEGRFSEEPLTLVPAPSPFLPQRGNRGQGFRWDVTRTSSPSGCFRNGEACTLCSKTKFG